MTGVRRLCRRQRWLAAWLVAAALAVRVLVPGGYMPAARGGLELIICPGHMMPMATAAPTSGMSHHGSGEHDGDKAEQPCAFAGLALPSLAADGQPALPVHPATKATTFVAALAAARAPPRRAFLRPFLRGPPSIG